MKELHICICHFVGTIAMMVLTSILDLLIVFQVPFQNSSYLKSNPCMFQSLTYRTEVYFLAQSHHMSQVYKISSHDRNQKQEAPGTNDTIFVGIFKIKLNMPLNK